MTGARPLDRGAATASRVCEECGFHPDRWRARDVATLHRELGYWWRLATAGISAERLGRRPGPGRSSVLELGWLMSSSTAGTRRRFDRAAGRFPGGPGPLDAGPGSGGWPADGPGAPGGLDPAGVVTGLEAEGAALALAIDRRAGREGAAGPDLTAAAHGAAHALLEVARALAEVGAANPREEGRVARVNVSTGGVPKVAVAGTDITWDGLVGDSQADRKHHGRPFQAVCLWSAEVVAALAAEGHPVFPGAVGENLTVSGLDWPRLRPGALVEVGGALLEVSFPAVPCRKQVRWFADGDYNRLSHDRSPGVARWYAWVRRPGPVATGDRVVVNPWPAPVG